MDPNGVETNAEKSSSSPPPIKENDSSVRGYITGLRLVVELTIFLVSISMLWHKREKHSDVYNDIMPLYITETIDFMPKYNEYIANDVTFDQNTHVPIWKAKMDCARVPTHEMCTCLDATTSWIAVRDCLLQKVVPMHMIEKGYISLLAMVCIWLGIMCGASWVSVSISNRLHNQQQNIQSKWEWLHTAVGAAGLVVMGFSLITGIVFGCMNDGTGWNFIFLFFLFYAFLLATIGAVNRHFMVAILPDIFGKIPNSIWNDTSKSNLSILKKQDDYYNHTMIQQFLFYSNLLLVGPAIGVVLHLSHHWYNFDQIANTIFLVLGLISIDAFAMHMTTHWEQHLVQSGPIVNVKVGMIKMFAWIINVVSIYLLVTINYPTVVDEAVLGYGMYGIFILFLLITFLLPDIVREFSHIYTINALNFRIFGECLLRITATTFILYHVVHHIEEHVALAK